MTVSLGVSRSLIACFAVAASAACRGPQAPAATNAPPASGAATATTVVLSETARANARITTATVRRQVRADRIEAPGLLALDEGRTARIGSLQEGLILETVAQVGDRVRPRQLLATMHGHAMHDAWAGYRKAIADRRRLDKALAFAVEAHDRAQRLYADKAISLQELQRAEVERVSATEMVVAAKAEVSRSIEELEHVGVIIEASAEDGAPGAPEESKEQIPVRSPIGGVVLERLVTTGTTVTPGTPLFVVSELSTLWAIAEVDESHLAQVRTGRPVDVLVAAYPSERFAGTITFIADTVNPKTRRITVRSTIPNTDGRLKPEMFASVMLGEGEPRPMLVVPHAAIQTIDGRSTVFVEDAAGRYVARPVALGPEADGVVEVTSGLTEGETIVVDGSFALKAELAKAAAGAQGGQ